MKQLDKRVDAVIAAGQAHDQRILKMEADAKILSDGMGTMGWHVQAMDDPLRAHIGGTVGDLNQAMLAINVALRKTVSALEDRLGEFQGSAQELMDRTHHGLTQFQERTTEAEKAIQELKQKAPPEDRRTPPGEGQRQPFLGPEYYDMSSPGRAQQSEASPGRA